MNRIIRLLTGWIFVCGLGGASALAQGTPASAQVEATATLIAPQTPIALAGGRSLDFGDIAVPNGRSAGAVCQYDYRADNAGGSLVVWEIRPDGSTDFTNPSNCEARGTPRLARFDVSCSPNIPVFFDLGFSSTLPGITLAPSPLFTAGISQDGGTSNYASWNGPGTYETACTASGALDVHVGALVRLSSTAAPGTNVSIGTITLEASY